ncbi:MAG: hypothetical protein RIQ47_958 [Bacteroidota bacterium]|jgi:hypothetical protein
MHFSSSVVMVRPRNFHLNPQTILDNHFQTVINTLNREEIENTIEIEFDGIYNELINAGINVKAFNQDDGLDTPDAIFPNNWFSTHPEHIACLYPMKAPNRRLERRKEITDWLRARYYKINDLAFNEEQGKFLEGTGSLVLDNKNRMAYAAVSDRTHPKLVVDWCRSMNYKSVLFSACDKNSNPIYHTNVVLCIGNGFTICCFSAIRSEAERRIVAEALENSGNIILDISMEQLHHFCGNGLQLKSKTGEHVFLISKNGWEHLSVFQREIIKENSTVITPNLSLTEQLGGGSARCMVAELF